MLQRERLDDIVCRLLRLDTPTANMSHWQEIIRKLIAPAHRVRVGVVGKYIELQDAYKSVYEAIIHGGIANDCGVEIVKLDAEDIERQGPDAVLKGLGGILVPGGFGERGIEGKILAAKYAREIDREARCRGHRTAGTRRGAERPGRHSGARRFRRTRHRRKNPRGQVRARK